MIAFTSNKIIPVFPSNSASTRHREHAAGSSFRLHAAAATNICFSWPVVLTCQQLQLEGCSGRQREELAILLEHPALSKIKSNLPLPRVERSRRLFPAERVEGTKAGVHNM